MSELGLWFIGLGKPLGRMFSLIDQIGWFTLLDILGRTEDSEHDMEAEHGQGIPPGQRDPQSDQL